VGQIWAKSEIGRGAKPRSSGRFSTLNDHRRWSSSDGGPEGLQRCPGRLLQAPVSASSGSGSALGNDVTLNGSPRSVRSVVGRRTRRPRDVCGEQSAFDRPCLVGPVRFVARLPSPVRPRPSGRSPLPGAPSPGRSAPRPATSRRCGETSPPSGRAGAHRTLRSCLPSA